MNPFIQVFLSPYDHVFKNRKMKISLHITLALLLFLISCNERIPSDFEIEEQLFVSGLMTNETDFITLQIQKTVAFDDRSVNIVKNAQISVFTKDNNDKESLITDRFELIDETYTSTEKISPVVGHRYWVEIVLEDGTILKSDEEQLRMAIKIKEIKREKNIIFITFDDPIEEDNFYLYHFNFTKNGIQTERFMEFGNDRLFNGDEEAEISLVDDYLNEGTTLEVAFSNVNYNTFQYNSNLVSNQGESDFSLSSPINIIGNITNTKTNRRVLGNFSVIGFSSLSKEF